MGDRPIGTQVTVDVCWPAALRTHEVLAGVGADDLERIGKRVADGNTAIVGGPLDKSYVRWARRYCAVLSPIAPN